MNYVKKKSIFVILILFVVFLFACGENENSINCKVILNYNMNNFKNEEIYLDENNDKYTLPVPTSEGYVFLGWENEAGEIIVEILFNVDVKEIHLSAKWKKLDGATYKITYVLNGGKALENLRSSYIEGEEYVFPELTNESFEFSGWYESEDFSGERIFSTKNKNSDLVLYAKFINPQIIYELNGGYFLDEVKYEYVIGETYRLPYPERDDYFFVDWYETPNFSGEPIKMITSEMNRSITLYAKWEYLYEIRTIDYILEGGKFNEEVVRTYPEGKGCELPLPTREGYEFLGWYDSDLGRIIYEINSRAVGNKTLIARWEKIYDYSKINYVLNGGIFECDYPERYPETEGIDLVAPKKQGYFFRGFYTQSDFSGERISRISSTEKGEITLYAKWIEAKLENAYISFYGDSITTFDGYIPDGFASYYPTASASVKNVEDTWWYKTILRTNAKLLVNNSYGGTAVYGGKNQGVDEDRIKLLSTNDICPDIIIVYFGINDVVNRRTTTLFKDAYIKMVDSIQKIYPESKLFLCTLAYETNTDKYAPGLREAFSEIIETVANKKNCEIISFDKVLTSDKGLSCLGDSIHPNKNGMDLLSSEAIRTLNDYYNDNNEYYNIDYDLNGGKILETSYLTTYKNLRVNYKLPIPIRNGYKFLGWFDMNSNKITYITPNDKCDFMLKAKWEKIEKSDEVIEVKFIDSDGNEKIKQVKYGESVEKEENVSNEYIWAVGIEAFDFNEAITSSLIVREIPIYVYEIISSNFTKNVFNDLNLQKKYKTTFGEVSVEWVSSNKYIIDSTSGRVNPAREETVVSLVGKFTRLSSTITYEIEMIVDKIEFKSLDDIKPTFAYVYTNTSNIIIDNLTINTIDVANYGFARVTTNGEVSIAELTNLNNVFKLRKYGIRVLLCIGGYGTMGKEFSDAAFTIEGRKKLAKSIAETIEKYHFDGVDIDWEYPGYETGRDTSVDKPNYTLLMEEIRKEVKAKNSDYIVSAALPGGILSYTRYELNKLDNVLDYVHLMTYDLASSAKVTHHAAPFNGDYTPFGSVEQTVKTYNEGGISKKKLIVGIAFYGRAFYLNEKGENILGSTDINQSNKTITFTNIFSLYLEKSYASDSKVIRYFDEKSKAPYIYDSSNKVAISYDDKESIKAKLDYVKSNDLGGVMFWDYGEDLHGILLNAIYESK